jgi:hypothetical protein
MFMPENCFDHFCRDRKIKSSVQAYTAAAPRAFTRGDRRQGEKLLEFCTEKMSPFETLRKYQFVTIDYVL